MGKIMCVIFLLNMDPGEACLALPKLGSLVVWRRHTTPWLALGWQMRMTTETWRDFSVIGLVFNLNTGHPWVTTHSLNCFLMQPIIESSVKQLQATFLKQLPAVATTQVSFSLLLMSKCKQNSKKPLLVANKCCRAARKTHLTSGIVWRTVLPEAKTTWIWTCLLATC